MTPRKIALIGYGKMGKTIQQIALAKGHETPLIIDVDQASSLSDLTSEIDVAIEFSRPEVAVQNIKACFVAKVPVVSGTTGWLQHWDEVTQSCVELGGAFFYASNYSIGVNIFFALNKWLAEKMNHQPSYSIDLKEVHHTEKLDAPSGTAISLAEGILQHVDAKTSWINEPSEDRGKLLIISEREKDVPGTHLVKYQSDVDSIEIKHTAHSRTGFAQGALSAAEWLVGKRGVFGMDDMLQF